MENLEGELSTGLLSIACFWLWEWHDGVWEWGGKGPSEGFRKATSPTLLLASLFLLLRQGLTHPKLNFSVFLPLSP